jgi:glycine cleavage system transcriptional repressor
MEKLLITSICGVDSTLFTEVAKLAGKHDCNIAYSHIFCLAANHTLTMEITGNWSSIAKIESALPSLAKRLEVELVFKRSHQEKVDRFFLPYQIEIVAVNQPGVIYEIMEFLDSMELHIERLETYSTVHQQTPILKFTMSVDIPADGNIADLREQFLLFCDELNLDGVLEPKK